MAAGDFFDSGADFRLISLTPFGMVHLRHFLRRLQAAGQSAIHEMHLVILSVVEGRSRGELALRAQGSPKQQWAELKDGGHKQVTRIRHFAAELIS